MDLTLKFYTDPGHGWLAVKRKHLQTLGIQDKVSPYSYQKGQTVYLEEDCDASLFFDAAKAQGWKIGYVTKYNNNSPIRSYESYKASP